MVDPEEDDRKPTLTGAPGVAVCDWARADIALAPVSDDGSYATAAPAVALEHNGLD